MHRLLANVNGNILSEGADVSLLGLSKGFGFESRPQLLTRNLPFLLICHFVFTSLHHFWSRGF